jgi:hypothetical protein
MVKFRKNYGEKFLNQAHSLSFQKLSAKKLKKREGIPSLSGWSIADLTTFTFLEICDFYA